MEEHTTMPTHSTQQVKESEGQTSSGTATLAAGTAVLQSFKPMSGICEAFCGMHMYPNDRKRQVIAYHYCHLIDEDRRQCLVYDSDSQTAKLIGIEYIISEKLFKTLDENEKKYWHSHKYECESGLLVQVTKSMVPEMVAQTAELAPLQTLVNTYGKHFQLWQPDEKGEITSQIPMGPPQLLVSLTHDDQINYELLAKRDRAMGISTTKKRAEREGTVKGNPLAPGADLWETSPWQIYDQGSKGVVSAKEE